MKYLDLTFPTPEENLACDEALLERCEEGLLEDDILRFWEPSSYFAVLGYSNKIQTEVNQTACQKAGIPIFRRPSGGGTVLQGPGCLNFSLILKIKNSKALQNLVKTNAFVLKRNQKALESALGLKINVRGMSDLALDDRKFSGNAQRRKRHCLLYHGTFLLRMKIHLMENLIRFPSRQPLYRKGRAHEDFLTNLKVPATRIKEALRLAWSANKTLDEIPTAEIAVLVRSRYALDEWNFK